MLTIVKSPALWLLGLMALIVTLGVGLASSGALASAPAHLSNTELDAGSHTASAPLATCTPGTDYVITSTTGIAIVPGTNDIGNHCDDCPTTITLPFTYNFYGVAYNRVTATSNGNLQFSSSNADYNNACLPAQSINNAIFAHWDDLLTNHLGAGIFTSVSGTPSSQIFNIEWRANYISDNGNVNFEVRLYEGQARFDIIYGAVDQGGSSATVGVQRDLNAPVTQYECSVDNSLQPGLQLTFRLPSCAPQGGTPTPTSTPSSCGPNSNFIMSQSTGAIVPGVTLVPFSQGDDVVVNITLPFTFQFYGQGFPSVNASTNGNLQFSSASPDFFNVCLPNSRVNNLIAPYWDDLLAAAPDGGIYTSVSGSAPNRIFNIEWRACLFDSGTGGCGAQTNFEVRLYEVGEHFDIVYGQVSDGSSATVGVQKRYGNHFTQFECNTGGITSGLLLSFSLNRCSTPTSTPTPTCPPLLHQQIGLNNPGKPNVIHQPKGGLNRLAAVGNRVRDEGIAPLPHPIPSPYSPSAPFTFALDDGTRDTSIGFGQGAIAETAAIWLNRFSPGSAIYPLTINQISVLWPTQTGITDTLVGKTARLLVYRDADGDNDPSNATLVGQQNVTIGALETFESYAVNISVSGPGDLYIGFEDLWATSGYSPRLYPASEDTTDPQVRSWVAAMSTGTPPNINNLGGNDLLGTVDSFGLPGNFTVRASADGQGTLCSTATPSSTPTNTRTLTPTNTTTATRTNTPTNTPSAANLVGHVTWAGSTQPNTRQAQTLTLSICLASGGPTSIYNATTDTSGFFTVSVEGLTPGVYNWRDKGFRSLANGGTLTLTGGDTSQEMGAQRGGDANNDNLVSSTDFNTLRGTFGKTNGDPGYDAHADFDNNNSVGSTDFNIQRPNFGILGAPVTCP